MMMVRASVLMSWALPSISNSFFILVNSANPTPLKRLSQSIELTMGHGRRATTSAGFFSWHCGSVSPATYVGE